MGVTDALRELKSAYDQYVLLRREIEALQHHVANFEAGTREFVAELTKKLAEQDRDSSRLAAEMEASRREHAREVHRLQMDLDRQKSINDLLAGRVQALESRFDASLEAVLMTLATKRGATKSKRETVSIPAVSRRRLPDSLPPADSE